MIIKEKKQVCWGRKEEGMSDSEKGGVGENDRQ